jgi:hypothetical protein
MRAIGMMPAIVLLICGLVPHSTIAFDRCDVVQIDHYYDDRWSLVFDQMIFWEWSEEQSMYRVLAWRLIKSKDQCPLRDWVAGGYVVRWMDGSILREVRAESIRESWSQSDQEVENRNMFPVHKRRLLNLEGKYKIKGG